jgi:very-short-patch-repair endonuclease
LHPGVYLARGHRWTAEATVRAAMLWAGESATLSGPAAAWWHGLPAEPPGAVQITVPAQHGGRPRPNVELRRRNLDPLDRVRRKGVWVTRQPLTALETAVTLGASGGQMLDRALQRGVDFADVVAAHHRNLGRHGSAKAGRLLMAAADRAASHAERLMIKLLRGAGLTGWVTGYQLAGYLLDFAFKATRVAVEVDGWAWHWDAERFRGDRRRQNRIVLRDWTVLRYTWHDLTERPSSVIGQIRAAAQAL